METKRRKKHLGYEEHLEKMIDHIRNYPDGILIKLQDVRNILNLNEAYSHEVLIGLREYPGMNIRNFTKCSRIFNLSEFTTPEEIPEPRVQRDTDKPKKEHIKRIPTDSSVEIITVKATLEPVSEEVAVVPEMSLKYRNLTTDQAKYAESILCTDNRCKESVEALMKILNAMVKFKEHNGKVYHYDTQVGDALILKRNQVKMFVELLAKKNLLEIQGDCVKLLLSNQDYLNNEFKTEDELVNIVEKAIAIEIHSEEIPVQEIHEESIHNESVVENNLIENLINFSGIMSNFEHYVRGTVSEIGKGRSNPAEIENLNLQIQNLETLNDTYKTQLTDGNTLLERLIKENKELNNKLNEKIVIIQDGKETINAYKEANDKLFSTMQIRFQGLLADINSTILDYTRIPIWEMKPSDSAKVQASILMAITSATEEILKSETNKDPRD